MRPSKRISTVNERTIRETRPVRVDPNVKYRPPKGPRRGYHVPLDWDEDRG